MQKKEMNKTNETNFKKFPEKRNIPFSSPNSPFPISSPCGGSARRVMGAGDLGGLLPQQPPFVMVDNLLDINETIITTNLCIKPENIFVKNGVLTAPGIIENIAQTGAARMGYINKYINQSEVKLGFIGEIKNLTIEKYPRVGDTIETTVEVKNEILSTLLVQTQVKCGQEIIASGNMKIVMTEIGKA